MNRPEREARERVIRTAFGERFDRAPTVWVRAPGRVDAMGSHTDYNEGFVLTVSIDRDTWIAAAPRDDGHIHAHSLNDPNPCELVVGDILGAPSEGWGRYLQAVASVLVGDSFAICGCDAVIHGTLPLASGLGSSASLEAATALMFSALGGYEIDRREMALLCQRAENEVVGVSCGILDQYSSILGKAGAALLLDCRNLTHEYVPLPPDLRLVICDTRTRRELSGSDYGERRAACETGARILAASLPGVRTLRDVAPAQLALHEASLPPTVARRCRFVVEENERVHRLAAALPDGDRAVISRLCEASYAGARDLFEIAVPAMESMFEAMASAPGVVGARQAGAGFGGCMLAFVDSSQVDAFAASTAPAYESDTGIVPEIYAVRSAAGAGRLPDF